MWPLLLLATLGPVGSESDQALSKSINQAMTATTSLERQRALYVAARTTTLGHEELTALKARAKTEDSLGKTAIIQGLGYRHYEGGTAPADIRNIIGAYLDSPEPRIAATAVDAWTRVGVPEYRRIREWLELEQRRPLGSQYRGAVLMAAAWAGTPRLKSALIELYRNTTGGAMDLFPWAASPFGPFLATASDLEMTRARDLTRQAVPILRRELDKAQAKGTGDMLTTRPETVLLEADPIRRVWLARGVTAVGIKQEIGWQYLEASIASPLSEIRLEAARALDSTPPDGDRQRALILMGRLIDDRLPDTRALVARSLSSSGDIRVAEALTKALKDPSPAVRLDGLLGLHDMGEATLRSKVIADTLKEESDPLVKAVRDWVTRTDGTDTN